MNTLTLQSPRVNQCFSIIFSHLPAIMRSPLLPLNQLPSAQTNEVTPLAKLRQVASTAGVSAATVSRALNHPQLLSPATLAHVRATMAALDFSPDPRARALSSGRSRLIGALIPTIGHSIFEHYMQAVQDECSDADYTLVLGVYRFDPKQELRQVQRLVDAGIEGFLLVGFNHEARLFETMASRQLAYVCTSVYDPKSVHPNVGYDNFNAGQRLVEHLVDLGHRQFGLITGNTQKNDRMAQRLAGIRAALAAQGLALPSKAIFEGDYTLVDGRAGFRHVLKDHQPTALICGNDVIALGVLQQARDDGMDVPGDVSVVGFDGLAWAGQFSPALTTMQVPMAQMGRVAAQAIIARVEGKPSVHAQEIAVQLIKRETTAAPPVPKSKPPKTRPSKST
jgi:LacI family transcriptional regulator